MLRCGLAWSGRRVPFVEKGARRGSVPAVWGSLLGMAVLFAINPVLLAIIVLMISRPRPVQNLLAYWVGSVIVNVPCLLVPLLVLHVTFTASAHDLANPATSPTVRYTQLGLGVLALSAAALMIVRSARQRAQLPTSVGNTSIMVLDSDTPREISSPFGRAPDTPIEGASVFRRLLARLQNSWEDGALWVSLVFGLGGFPPPPLVLFVDTTIVASGAAIGTQVIAALAVVVAMFAVVEITLISYLAAPAKTLAVLRPLHDWALAHRRQVLITIFAVCGSFQVAHSMGIV
jgi:hypothetical protein